MQRAFSHGRHQHKQTTSYFSLTPPCFHIVATVGLRATVLSLKNYPHKAKEDFHFSVLTPSLQAFLWGPLLLSVVLYKAACTSAWLFLLKMVLLKPAHCLPALVWWPLVVSPPGPLAGSRVWAAACCRQLTPPCRSQPAKQGGSWDPGVSCFSTAKTDPWYLKPTLCVVFSEGMSCFYRYK